MSVENPDIQMIRKEALAQLEWRDLAALGLWKRIYLERLIIDARDNDDYRELHALLDCLTEVVPVIPGPFAGEGPLSPPRRSTLHDSAFPQTPRENSRYAYLSRYIDQGGYDQAIKTVAEILDRQHLHLDSKLAKDLNREEQLAHAVALFEQIEGIVDPGIWGPPNDCWLIEAEAFAGQVLHDLGVDTQALGATIAPIDPITTLPRQKHSIAARWRICAPTDPAAVALRDVPDDSRIERRSRLWLAAMLLLQIEEARKILSTATTSSPELADCHRDDEEQVWTDAQMREALNHIGACSKQIGMLIGALEAKRIERFAIAGKGKSEGAAKGGRAKKENLDIRNARILELARPQRWPGESEQLG